jgi:putative transposase
MPVFLGEPCPPGHRNRRMAEVLPRLYLHGPSTSDFAAALEQFLGTSHGLSAATTTG